TWIHPEEWFPYQMSTFVTPSFAGYVSGHSTFSRAAAEVLAAYTGSPYFPGGVGTFTAKKDAYLEFERGPSVDVVLQWATYFDASDQSGISRIYGGIHFPVDDGPGRIMGAQCGRQAWALAQRYFDGSILHEVPATTALTVDPDQGLAVRWNGRRGLFYRVESGPDPLNFDTIEGTLRSQNEGMILDLAPPEGTATRFYRIVPLSRTDESQGSNQ
ncbi:MAG: vanadium-dependent haloperoxidase, partial [Verrucomicrobiota bacterium]